MKDDLKANGNYEVAINNSIIDYLNTYRLNNEFNIFHVIKISNENIIGVSINGGTNKWQLDDIKVGDKRKYFPSRFKEIDGKLFYWSDLTSVVRDGIIHIMKKYKILDAIKYPNYFILDETGHYSKGEVDYYFCKTNYLKYKKVKTTISIGYYKPPNLNCK